MGLLGQLVSHVRQVLAAGVPGSALTPAQADEQCGLFRQALDDGDLARAAGVEQALVAQRVQRPDMVLLRGRLAHARGEAEQALQHFLSVLDYTDTTADAHFWCAVVHMQQGREAEALKHARQAEYLRPGNAQMLALIGTVHHHQGDTPSAIAAFDSALRADPEDTNALASVAAIYFHQQQWSELLPLYRRLLAQQPGTPDMLCACATTLLALGQTEEAWLMFEQAIAGAGARANIHADYATALFRDGQLDAARAQLAAALRLKPDDAMIHVGSAGCDLIANGSTPAAWAQYEWRRKVVPAHFAERSPPWSGEPLAGKRVLIYNEQGIGDWLLFSRFIPLLADASQHTVLQIPPALSRLARASAARFGWNVAEWIESFARVEQDIARCDYEMPLLSAIHSRGFAVKKAGTPYLHVNDELVAQWSEQLGLASDQRLRIGLVWAGNPVRADDYLRSIPLEQLAALGQVKNVIFVSLQMDARSPHKAAPLPFDLVDATPGIRDFADTAAIMRNLDLMLSIDTAAAHLAGALAVPCWVLLSRVLDWRWQMGGVEQPWFANHRSFRVTQPHGWAVLMQRVTAEIDQQRDALMARRGGRAANKAR